MVTTATWSCRRSILQDMMRHSYGFHAALLTCRERPNAAHVQMRLLSPDSTCRPSAAREVCPREPAAGQTTSADWGGPTLEMARMTRMTRLGHWIDLVSSSRVCVFRHR